MELLRQCMYCKVHEMLKKARKHKKAEVTKTFWTDGTKMVNAASLCQMLGGLENRSFKTMNIALEDHSYVATRQEVGTRNHGNFL